MTKILVYDIIRIYEQKDEEHTEVMDVFNWLFGVGRDSNVERATKDEEFYKGSSRV